MILVEKSAWEMVRDQANTLIKSGFLPKKIRNAEQAIAIIMTGRELGIGTMAALNTINVIEGVPSVSPQLMLALIQRTGEVEDLEIALNDTKTEAFCRIKRRGRKPYTAYFGKKEADSLGLSIKDNYKKQPGVMYEWRAVAAACRKTFADAILGLYTTEEISGGVDTGTGPIIDMQMHEQAEPDAPAATVAKAVAKALTAQPVEATPAAAEPEAIDAEVVEPTPEPTPAATQPEPAENEPAKALAKGQLMRLVALTERLEAQGLPEAEWRRLVDEVTMGRTQSRKELNEDEAKELIAAFAHILNKKLKNGNPST